MTFGLVYASYSLPKWQTVKLTSFKFALWAFGIEGTKVKGKSRGGLEKWSVFSLNFSSAGNWPFMAGKAKIYARGALSLGGGGVLEWGTWPLLCWEIKEPSSLKCYSLILRHILRKSAIVIFRQQFKTFDSDSDSVCTLLSTFRYIHSFPLWESDWITTCVFLKLLI